MLLPNSNTLCKNKSQYKIYPVSIKHLHVQSRTSKNSFLKEVGLGERKPILEVWLQSSKIKSWRSRCTLTTKIKIKEVLSTSYCPFRRNMNIVFKKLPETTTQLSNWFFISQITMHLLSQMFIWVLMIYLNFA